METIRLKRVRQPSQIERLLERLVVQAGLVPADAYQLRDPEGLLPALQRVLLETANKEKVWTCWSNGFRIWLFAAEMSLPLSRERGARVLGHVGVELQAIADELAPIRTFGSGQNLF